MNLKKHVEESLNKQDICPNNPTRSITMAKKTAVKKEAPKKTVVVEEVKEVEVTKKDLISMVSEESEYTKEAVQDIATATFEKIAQLLSEGKELTIYKFGTFSVKDTAARMGRNPATGEAIEIPAGKRVSFKFSSFMKNSVKAVDAE